MDTNIRNPKVTVVMPVYNSEKYVAAAIQSILNQTFKDFELIIINDGSTDESEKIILSFNDPRVRYIKNEKNLGLVGVRNLGLDLVESKYIALLDSDDIARRTRLSEQVKFLDENPQFGIVGTWVRLIDDNGRLTSVKWKSNLLSEEIPPTMILHNCLAQSSVMIRAEAVKNERYREGYAPAEDYDLWVRIAYNWSIAVLPKFLTNYRINPAGQSKIKAEEQKRAIEKIARKQLLDLDVIPTDEELKIHLTNDGTKDTDILTFLSKREFWLKKLIGANKVAKKYGEFDFNSAMGKAWFKSCYANTSSGINVWKKFWESELNLYFSKSKNIVETTKFFIRCFVKKK